MRQNESENLSIPWNVHHQKHILYTHIYPPESQIGLTLPLLQKTDTLQLAWLVNMVIFFGVFLCGLLKKLGF